MVQVGVATNKEGKQNPDRGQAQRSLPLILDPTCPFELLGHGLTSRHLQPTIKLSCLRAVTNHHCLHFQRGQPLSRLVHLFSSLACSRLSCFLSFQPCSTRIIELLANTLYATCFALHAFNHGRPGREGPLQLSMGANQHRSSTVLLDVQQI